MALKKKGPDSSQEAPFEEGMLLLEKTVRELEAGTLPLTESLQAYERGIRLVRELGNRLDAIEQKMVMLMDDGTEKAMPTEET